jgi:iron complex outermembrane recepter protein
MEGSMKENTIRRMLAVPLFLLLMVLLAFHVRAEQDTAQGLEPVQAKMQKEEHVQKKDYEAYTLGELYVKGDRLPAAQEVTQSSEITAEQIEATNSTTVAEALAFVPGIKVTSGRKNEPNVSIHGFDQSRALILIDGVPYYETNYGKLDLNVLPVDNIAKIEIQKGVSSVLYGPNGLAGVINIVTKKPTDKPSLNALVETGDYRENRVSVSHGMKIGMVNYWLNYSHQESKGWYMSDDFEPRPGTIRFQGVRPAPAPITTILEDGGVRDNSAEQTDALWAKVGIEPSADSEYYLNFHYITRDKEAPASIGSIFVNSVFLNRPMFSQFAQMPRYDNWGGDLSGQQKLCDRVTVKAKLFYHDHVDDYDSYDNQYYINKIAVSRFEDNTLGGSFLSDLKLAAIDTLRFAFNYRRDSHKERNDEYLPFAESVSYTGSFGLENELNIWKSFSLVAGLGYDWFDVASSENTVTKTNGDFNYQVRRDTPGYNSELNPMVGATYTFCDGTRVFGSFARKVRFPTLQQLYASRGGNVDLNAETSENYVFGVARSLTQHARGEASFFRYDVNDFITRDVPTIDGKYMNVGEVLIYGFELWGDIYPAKDLSFGAGYTYTSATDKSAGHVTSRVLNVPVHKVDLSVHYLVPVVGINLDMNGVYVGRTWGQLSTSSSRVAPIETDPYFVLNCRIAKTLWRNVEAYFAVDNLFDRNYEPELDFPAAGRNMFVGLKASF